MLRSYRYNIMQLNTLETFVGVRGGLNGNMRDVYFVRALGTSPDIANRIEDIDRRMDSEATSGRTKYIRQKGLPSIAKSTDDLIHWAELYDKWKEDYTTPLFSSISSSPDFEDCAKEALVHVLEIFSSSDPNRSNSMLRNFASKLLFWASEIIGKKNLKNWDEKTNIKIIWEDINKEQEYLFCYFLTRIGADIMLLLPLGDIEISNQLKALSRPITIGSFGNMVLSSYLPRPVSSTVIAPQNSKTPDFRNSTPTPVVKIPKREDRQAKNGQSSNTDTKKEKSFEDLAKLASSIVMITVHDNKGEIKGTGSGIMIGEKGYIITNFHVIQGGAYFSVRIEDNDNIYNTDQVIKYNTSFDLAVIRISHTLRPLPIYNGHTELVRGQKVVAIGSPLGMFNSVSDGIISGFRNIGDIDMIQFTAPTSPGSSGGAILNMQGEVIGISTAGIDHGQNINLAVPYNTIRLMANGFI